MTQNDKPAALSPLADPVIGAIFTDVESAGLAAQSLVGAILKKDGLTVGTVLSVTPQRYYKTPGERGCRVDILILTDRNEHTLVEIQMSRDASMLARNLFSASLVYKQEVPEGTPPELLAKVMPRVICIDILDFNIRSDSVEWFQPVKLLYSQPPYVTALPHFSVYCVQLPRFREAKRDFNDPAYCWMYAWDRAYREKLTMEEVIKLTPELQGYVEQDRGFMQYCQKFGIVTANSETKDEYYRWINEQMRQEGMRQAAEEDGMARGMERGMARGMEIGEARGRAQGIETGERNAKLATARNLLAINMNQEQVAKVTGLLLEEVLGLTGTVK
ncbi:MAG: PD-(D/E)XK nuclease family transposase [Synergistaceae bacterium]|jgi:predicted transposase/invertase (TIGR01784 family)|nr:PD-(D/E)XK nuclease family transposase [Synergistaceae bacterium]